MTGDAFLAGLLAAELAPLRAHAPSLSHIEYRLKQIGHELIDFSPQFIFCGARKAAEETPTSIMRILHQMRAGRPNNYCSIMQQYRRGSSSSNLLIFNL